jgi:hypothetical protein
VREGYTPTYKAYHEVVVTKSLGAERDKQLVDFIEKHIGEFKGEFEAKEGIPAMLFERKQDAQKFAAEITRKLGFLEEHITIKARKYTR